MSTISYGEEEPVDSNKTRDGRSKNRRVVVVVLA
jgi:outer membrane protein OmpA-like peptidoglycan-associated protein